MLQTRSNISNRSTNNQYFFQLKLLKLNITNPSEKPVRIAIFKGLQKLDEIKPVVASDLSIDLESLNCSLCFYIPQFDRKVSTQYKIMLEQVEKSEEISNFTLSVTAFIVSLVKDNTNSFYRKDKFGEDYQLQYILFVEKTKNDLNQSVRSFEQQNPVKKHDTQPKLSKSISNFQQGRMSAGQFNRQFSVLHEPSLGKRQPRKLIQSFDKDQNLNQTASIVATETIVQQKQSTMVRKRPYKEGSRQTKFILLSSVFAIGIIVYFIVIINNNSRQLQILAERLSQLI